MDWYPAIFIPHPLILMLNAAQVFFLVIKWGKNGKNLSLHLINFLMNYPCSLCSECTSPVIIVPLLQGQLICSPKRNHVWVNNSLKPTLMVSRKKPIIERVNNLLKSSGDETKSQSNHLVHSLRHRQRNSTASATE